MSKTGGVGRMEAESLVRRRLSNNKNMRQWNNEGLKVGVVIKIQCLGRKNGMRTCVFFFSG